MMTGCGFDSLLVEAVRQTYAQAVEKGYGDRLMASRWRCTRNESAGLWSRAAVATAPDRQTARRSNNAF
jgi:hypothetical protein